jgi:hypothetical protein
MNTDIKQGELAGWLKVISLALQAGNPKPPVPKEFIQHLVTLRCITVSDSGELAMTDKGELSLRMAEPTAWNI